MPQVSPFATVSKISQETALFDSKDRLLNFSSKGDFQTPLMLEACDLFFEKWNQTKGPLPLDSFLPESATFTAQQKRATEEQFRAILSQKSEDFCSNDLYLLLGFLKWEGNALAPSLLIPLDANPANGNLTISTKRPPLENIVLREKLKNTIVLPKAEDATINGQFSILLYFSLFEKAVASERNWKFSRHGLCLAFFNSIELATKRCYQKGLDEKAVNNSKFLKEFLSESGFQSNESVFENADFNEVFHPADHYFLYPVDSHTTKVMVDALEEKNSGYAIQALPGTAKMKVAANIVAESIAKGKKTLVISRRSSSMQNFNNTLKPAFRSYSGPERNVLEPELRANRDSFTSYYNAVNKIIPGAEIHLADLLSEFIHAPNTKKKYPEAIFQDAANLNFQNYCNVKKNLEEVSRLYFEEGGIEVRNAFQKVKVPSLDEGKRTEIAAQLEKASTKATELKPLIELLSKIGLFPTGIYLSGLADIIDLLHTNFNDQTPVFEQWELRSNSWNDYQDSLKALPEAGDKWVRYRRQTSDIYTDTAVDENILSIREEFANSLKATLKGLSDHYRSSRKQLLKVLRDPKSVSSDEQLLDLVDTLIELQENKRAYKDTSVLGLHLLGKDWLYEKSNWYELNQKIQYLYTFREAHAKDPQLDLLLQLLEKWNLFKELQPNFDLYATCVKELQASVRNITRDLALDTPLESLAMDKWLNEIHGWNENWSKLDTHLELTTLFNKISDMGCKALSEYIQNTENASKDIAQAFAHYWSGVYIQKVGQVSTDLFSLQPKARSQKAKTFRTQLDQFCNANFRLVHAAMEENPEIFSHISLEESLYVPANVKYDVALFLDADITTVVEALPTISIADKVIFIGDPHAPAIEHQPLDGYQDVIPHRAAIFQENILAASLRRGIPTREIWFAGQYANAALVDFANHKIYNHGIKQLPLPLRKQSKCQSVSVVKDKILAVAKAAIIHAEKHPGQTLGIIAFHQARCLEIESAILAMLPKNSNTARFFEKTNPLISYYTKPPERAVDCYRDTIFICAEAEGSDKQSFENKIAVCSTLAKQELQVFVSESDMAKRPADRTNLFWEWIDYLQKKASLQEPEAQKAESVLTPQVMEVFEKAQFNAELAYARGGIAVGPVVVDANNANRFLVLIEDDCTTERFQESVEDRIYIRYNLLRQAGWKVLNLWLPFWYMAHADEVSHIITTIAIEQSVAPPPQEDEQESEDEVVSAGPEITAAPYQVLHPKIEGTVHDKPLTELPIPSIITQMKFYIDYEAPLHEDLLQKRILELHKVERIGPALQQILNDALKQGIQNKRFIKTGKFFYSVKNNPVELRDRSFLPDDERKMMYVAPEERSLLPSSMDERAIKQTLGLLE